MSPTQLGRRQLLAGAGAVLLTAAIDGCTVTGSSANRGSPTTRPPPPARLPEPVPLRAGTDRITQITVCTRPFRAQGPRLDVEPLVSGEAADDDENDCTDNDERHSQCRSDESLNHGVADSIVASAREHFTSCGLACSIGIVRCESGRSTRDSVTLGRLGWRRSPAKSGCTRCTATTRDGLNPA